MKMGRIRPRWECVPAPSESVTTSYVLINATNTFNQSAMTCKMHT